jgi:hypothetical protein
VKTKHLHAKLSRWGMNFDPCGDLRVLRATQLRLDFEVCKFAGLQVCKFASLQVCKFASLQVCKFASLQVCLRNWPLNTSIHLLEGMDGVVKTISCPSFHMSSPLRVIFGHFGFNVCPVGKKCLLEEFGSHV